MATERRLIWASDAQKAILKAPTFEVEYHGIKNCVLIPVVAESLIKGIPSVDAVEVVHGEWIWTEEGKDDVQQCWVCSKCSDYMYFKTNYCPNCGAKMDGDTHD